MRLLPETEFVDQEHSSLKKSSFSFPSHEKVQINSIWLTEKSINGKTYFTGSKKDTNDQSSLRFDFSEKKNEQFSEKIWICKSKSAITRWAVMTRKCADTSEWNILFTGFISRQPVANSRKVYIATNNGENMPYGTRISSKKPCCTVNDSAFSYEPCCHYRHFPRAIYLPVIPKEEPNAGDWGSWSSCSTSCGGGSKTRTRQCELESDCNSTDRAYCEERICPLEWSEWSAWSSCPTILCNKEKKTPMITKMSYRERQCSGGDCTSDKMKQAKPCVCVESQWSEWSRCSERFPKIFFFENWVFLGNKNWKS
jgi:hypothetical protein